MADQTTQVTSASDWKGRKGTELPLPSGNVALVRSPGIQHFLKSGRLPNNLRTMIQKAIGGDEREKLQTLFANEEDIVSLLELMDNILLQVVIEPRVRSVPKWTDDDAAKAKCSQEDVGDEIPLDQRDDSVIYVDEVDLEDKAFIFQFAVGGTKDLESFRSGQKETLATLQSSQGLDVSTE